MKKPKEMLIKADQIFVEQLTKLIGLAATPMAIKSGLTPTTLTRYTSDRVPILSVLKTDTIEKVADTFDLDLFYLLAHREKIRNALENGGTVPPILDNRKIKHSIFSEHLPPQKSIGFPNENIIKGVHLVWNEYGKTHKLKLDKLAELTRMLTERIEEDRSNPSLEEVKRRAKDMLTVMIKESEATASRNSPEKQPPHHTD